MTNVWIGHIIAGILGVLLSLSIVFQRLERTLSVYNKLNSSEVDRITSDTGEDLSQSERESFVAYYNSLIYMGRTEHLGVHYDSGTTIYLRTGERIQMVMGERFYNVKRVKRNGKEVYFGLLDKQLTHSMRA